MFNYGLLPSVLVESFDFLENGAQFFVHYHGIIYKGRDKNFDNSFGNFGVIYYGSVNSPFVLYKIYLEILCRVIFNSLLKKILPLILVDFDRKRVSRFRGHSYCSGNDFLSFRRKKIISIFIKEPAIFSLYVLQITNESTYVDFMKQTFETYKKPEDYYARSLDIER